MIRVKPIEISWNPGHPIFAKESFLKAVSDEYGWLGGSDYSGKLRCILPYTIVQKAMVRMVRFRVETVHLDEALGVEEEKSFLDSTIEYFRSIGADIIIPATTNTIFRTYPTGAIAAPYGTLIIDLDRDEETLFNNLSSSHRRKIRLATKYGVKILAGLEHAEIAYALVRDTFKRSSMPFMDYAAFRRMVDGLGENIKIMVAEYRGAILGCIVIPFSGHSAYYVYGGSIPEPETGSMNLLHWEAIRLFLSLGVKRYDFCGVRIDPEKGSKQEGLMAFKERFGPRLVQGFMWKYSIKPLKSRIYSLAVRLLRGGDIVDAERHKLKPSGSLL
jgi:hypothetical protein